MDYLGQNSFKEMLQIRHLLYEETLFISCRKSAIKEVNDLAQGLEKLKRWYGSSFRFGDYDSGKRGVSGATFDHFMGLGIHLRQ